MKAGRLRTVGWALALSVVALGALCGGLWFVLVVMRGGGVVVFLRRDGVPTSAIATLVAAGVLVFAVPVAYLVGRWIERRGAS